MGLHSIISVAVHSHPLTWWAAWQAVSRLPFMPMHDRSYRALRHFVAAKPEGLFLDIGANNGISARVFRRMSPNYQIFSVEPNALLKPLLDRLARQDRKFTYKIAAAADHPGSAKLYVPVHRAVAVHPLASLDEAQALEGMRTIFGDRVAQQTQMAIVDVELVRIDDLQLSPTIIKVDAEAAELIILKGALETIRRCRPFLMLEIAWEDGSGIVDLLNSNDYVLLSYEQRADTFRIVEKATAEAVPGHCNYFAVPAASLQSLVSVQ